jgi:hypothetical protein
MNDFSLARRRSFTVNGFAAHLRAIVLQLQREVEHAQANPFERGWHSSFATVFAARC